MAKCDICGKIPKTGHNVSHSKRHTNRRGQPNVHPATMTIKGETKRVNICMKCLRTQQKPAQ